MTERAALSEALVMLAGHHVTSRSTARRHQRAIISALAFAEPSTRTDLEAALTRLNDRWGGHDDQGHYALAGKHPSIIDWLATRRDRPRTFQTLQAAAIFLLNGETSLQWMRGRCFAMSGQVLTTPVGYDAFREWLVRLGIARMIASGVYGPGPHAAAISGMIWSELSAQLSDRVATYQSRSGT